LPLLLPFGELKKGASVDSLALIPWSNSLLSSAAVPIAMAIFAAVLSVVLLTLPARIAFLVPLVAFASFYVTGVAARWQAHLDTHKLAEHRIHRGWIDGAVGPDARVTAIWIPSTSVCAPRKAWGPRWLGLWQNEFFNRSIRKTAYVVRPAPDGLPATRLRRIAASGAVAAASGSSFNPGYVVVDDRVRVAGAVEIARDRQTHSVLYRPSGQLRIAAVDSACAGALRSSS
jgi:hypothetical protein